MTRKRYRVIFADGMIVRVDAVGVQDAADQVYDQDDDGEQDEIVAIIAEVDAQDNRDVAFAVIDTTRPY